MRRDPSKRAPRGRASLERQPAPAGKSAGPSSSPIEVAPLPVRNGVISLTGYGVRVSVHNNQLVLADGMGNKRREGRFSSATSGVKRLVVRGNAGFITFDALQWLSDIGAGFVQIGYDGEVVAAIGPQGLNDPRLRRAQALAPWDGTGLDIMRAVLTDKLRGQAAVLERIDGSEGAIANILAAVEEMGQAATLQDMRTIEGKAALAYWRAWEHVPVSWVRRDEPRVPDHWRSFGARMSPISAKPRYAINPPNAILNYLYAVLESEMTLAIRAVGLDPGMGLLHVDQASRDSLTLDLMEAVRPQVDAYVLDLLAGQSLAAGMFFETGKGVCRVMPRLAHTLAETGQLWLTAIAPVVEDVAHALHYASRNLSSAAPKSARGPSKRERAWREPPTRLTHANKIARVSSRRAPAPPTACIACGAVLEGYKRGRRRYCDDCLPARKHQVAVTLGERKPSFHEQWKLPAEDDANPDHFTKEILPKLQNVLLRDIARVTGYSLGHSGNVRKGSAIPDPRHWDALLELCTDGAEQANPLRRGSGRQRESGRAE
jgi:CRISPR-associated endonuclease Cas1